MDTLPLDPKVLIHAMEETSTLDLFEDVVLFFFRRKLQNEAIPEFFLEVKKNNFKEVFVAVKNLHESICCFFDYVALHHKAEDLKNKMKKTLRACLKWKLDATVTEVFMKSFTFSFQFFLQDDNQHSNLNQESFDHEPFSTFCFHHEKVDIDTVAFRELQANYFRPMVQYWLIDLGLEKIFRDDVVVSILKSEIDRYVVETCSKQFEKCWIGDEKDVLGKWTKSHVLPWLQMVLHDQFNRFDWEEKLLYILYNSYTKLRISEMLTIITEYPDSTPVLHDLKLCLQHTRQRPCLIKSLKQDITNRVLHPGVSTQNIITVYIASVKALRELDISGVVMEMVLETCTAYLTQREDSVRMIMQGLLWDDGSNDLAAELARNQKADEHAPLNERVTTNPEDWMPDPREADPKKSDKSVRTSDIVTLFIGMYGSKEKFIKEYQKLLSKRLLQTWYSNKNEATEIRNLELLKKRFGEDDMSKCAVMLKDVADSRRINSNIKEDGSQMKNTDFELHTMIVSSEFWPEIFNQEFDLPAHVTSAFEEFNKGYEGLKVSRSLTWLHSVGMVDLELEMEDRTVEVKVTPLQAVIIRHFEDKKTWSLNDLGDQLKIPPTVLRRKMTYWIQQGIIKQIESDSYVLVEKRDGAATPGDLTTESDTERIRLGSLDTDDEDGDDDEDDAERKQKNDQVLWNYVQGMLKNLESLALDRIHKMLQMFVMHDANVQTDYSQLREMLNGKVQKGLLLYEQGKYKFQLANHLTNGMNCTQLHRRRSKVGNFMSLK